MADRSRAWALALLVAIFLAGGAVGWWLRGGNEAPREPRLRETEAMVAYLAHELGLTAAQQDSVRTVFQRHRPEIDALWSLVHPRVDSLRNAIQREISAQLTPGQQARYRDLGVRAERARSAADSTKEQR